mmetsp:Transcript_119108/g.384599  ORF Transcript_119108/g.384599 Transcript_119108/m.384599 type:complete len:87 (-) Transcript_119108:72-332(-)
MFQLHTVVLRGCNTSGTKIDEKDANITCHSTLPGHDAEHLAFNAFIVAAWCTHPRNMAPSSSFIQRGRQHGLDRTFVGVMVLSPCI